MAKRPCLEDGCPTLVDRGRCTTHTRERDRARGTRQERGYDREHELAREAWRPNVEAGLVTCRRAPFDRCLEDDPVIRPGQPWQLGHPDVDCPAPRAPEHERCNLATMGRA